MQHEVFPFLVINSVQMNHNIAIFLAADKVFETQSVPIAKNAILDLKSYKSLQLPSVNELISIALNKAGISLKDLKFIGVVNGPGSYSQLRIGVAAANSLGFALNISTVAISLFDIYIADIKKTKGLILATVPNYKGGVFAQIFDAGGKRYKPFELDINTIPTVLIRSKHLLIVGGGLNLVKELNLQNYLPATKVEYLTATIRINNKKLYLAATEGYNNLNGDQLSNLIEVLYIKDPKITPAKSRQDY